MTSESAFDVPLKPDDLRLWRQVERKPCLWELRFLSTRFDSPFLKIHFLYRSPAPYRAAVICGSFPRFFSYLTQWFMNTQPVIQNRENEMFHSFSERITIIILYLNVCAIKKWCHKESITALGNLHRSCRVGKEDSDASLHHHEEQQNPSENAITT